jgi:GNAT superfamily N-acetyltransferase
VPRLEIMPFEECHLPEAGRLLADRHRRHRAVEPLLPPRYESPDEAQAEVAASLSLPGASGAVAARGGRLVGYLVGAPKPGDVWGPNVWVENAGHAVASTEDIRDLYAAAATTWVEQGRTAHYAMVPAHDRSLLDAWFRLAFGHQHTHGIRELPDEPPRIPPKVTIRRPDRADIPALARLEVSLPEHQGLAPTFSAGERGSFEESLAEWEEDFDDPDFTVFVAEHEGEVIGSAVGCRLEKSSSNTALARPDDAGFLGFAAVLPASRGLGVGRALGEAVLAWSAEQGHSCVVTDWRATNLLSSRAWPALGFRPTFARVHRLLGY